METSKLKKQHRLKDVMTRDVDMVGPETDLSEAAKKMKKQGEGALPVCDGKKLRGIITERDIVLRAIAEGKDLKKLKVSDVMSKKVHFCFDDEGLDVAAELMKSKKILRVVVLNRKRKFVGMVSIGDLAVETELAGETLRSLYRESIVTPIALGIGLLGFAGWLGAGALFRSETPRRQKARKRTSKRAA